MANTCSLGRNGDGDEHGEVLPAPARGPFPLLRSTSVGFGVELPQVGPIPINKTKHQLKPCPTVVPSAYLLAHLLAQFWEPFPWGNTWYGGLNTAGLGGGELCCLVAPIPGKSPWLLVTGMAITCSPNPNPLKKMERSTGAFSHVLNWIQANMGSDQLHISSFRLMSVELLI